MRLLSIGSIILFLALAVISFGRSASASDLIDVIPGLYGGDGIHLRDVGTHQPHFTGSSLAELAELTSAASEISFPVPNSQGGFTFRFNPLLDDFEKKSSTLGPIFAQRAETIGKGKLNLGFNYTFIDFTRFDGDDLDSLSATLDHQDSAGDGRDSPAPLGYQFEKDTVILDLDIELKSHIFSFYGSYGVTKNIEVGFLIPVIQNELKVKSSARVQEHSSKASSGFGPTLHAFDPLGFDGDSAFDEDKETQTGIGDIVLRVKYNALDLPKLKISPALQIRLPTGNDRNLMGKTRLGLTPSIIVSANLPLWDGIFSPHLNLGYEVNSGIKGQDEIDYTVGFDYGREIFGDLATVAFDVIGSHETQKRDGVGDDIIDLSVGVKWNFYKQALTYANVIVPLNDQGLRPDVITSVGFETAIR